MPEAIGQKSTKVFRFIYRASHKTGRIVNRRCRAQSVGCLEINNPIDRAQDATQWQATRWPGANSRSAGGSLRQRSLASGQRDEKRQPAGIGRIRDLALHQRLRFAVRVEGRHRSHQGAGIGMEGRLNSASRLALSTSCPRYITATSSHKCSTTPRSWEINRNVTPRLSRRSENKLMICA